MKSNTISSKVLHKSAKIWLQKAMQALTVKEYGKGSVRTYRSSRCCSSYNQFAVEQLQQDHIEGCLIFIKEKPWRGRIQMPEHRSSM